MESQDKSQLGVIGSTEFVEVAGAPNIPAKIDTGADTSAIWASNIDMSEDGVLSFILFAPDSPLYSGERVTTSDYLVKRIRSSYGDRQIRYRVKLPIKLGGKTFETTFTLANRSKNRFPVLIGRHTIENRFLVDVSKTSIPRAKDSKSTKLAAELQENPYDFHQRYFVKKENS